MNRWIISALLGLIVTVLHLWVWTTPVGTQADFVAEDFWYAIRGPVTPPEDVVIIALDEESYGFLGVPFQSAWPRRYHAALLELLSELGAKRVLFDVLFNSPGNPEEDKDFAAALKKLPVVLGVESKVTSERGNDLTRQDPPLPIFKANAERLGLVGYNELYGYVRAFYKGTTDRGVEAIPPISETALDTNPYGVPPSRAHINYYGPENTITTIPVKDILTLNPSIDPLETTDAIRQADKRKLRAMIHGKVVFVGLKLLTDVGVAQKDRYRTPFEKFSGMFGVEIHATAALNVKYGNWIDRLSAPAETLGLLFFTFIVATLIFGLRPDLAGLLLGTTIVAWIGAAYTAFTYQLLLPGITACAMFLPLAYLISTLYYYLTTRKSQLQTKRAFEFYLSPEMAEEVAKNPASLALGGKGEYATAMFTDIAGFTTITETMSPEQVSEMLNAYFSEVMEAIFPLKGTLIKFIGDAVFALWGAPLKVPDHALKACQAALQIQDEVERFNSTARFPPLKTRIGIHTGSMVVGNLGSRRRFDFTAIGDSVNLASRVEGVNKYFGTTIIVTEAVIREIKTQIPALLLGSIAVAGKNESIELFTIRKSPFPPSVVSKWEKALRDFQFRRWASATENFNAVITEAQELSTAATLYLDEIAEYERNPPPDEWTGTVSFSKK